MDARTPFLAIVAAAGLLLSLGTPAAADLVQLTDGTWLVDTPENDPPSARDLARSRLRVASEQVDVVRYRIRGLRAVQTYPRRKVARVWYAEQDATYLAALEALDRRDWPSAADALRKAASESKLAWVRQDALLALVRFHHAGGEKEEAVAVSRELLNAFPRTKDLVETLERMARLHLELGRFEKARATFARLGRVRGVEGVADRAAHGAILVDERRAGTAEAYRSVRRRYDRLLADVDSGSVTALRIRLGQARCLLGEGATDEALALFREVASSTDDPRILAAAYVGRGHVHFAREDWSEARRAYLRVALLWHDDPDLRREALSRAGHCFRLVRDAGFRPRSRELLAEAAGRLLTSRD